MKLRTTANPDGFPITIGDATITVNPMPASALSRLRQKHTTIRQGAEVVNGLELTKEMFDKVVLGWQGVTDETGADLPCTSESKRAVCEYNSGFAGEVFKVMDAAEEERRLGEQGNSQPGPSGTSAQAE